ncbi:MAG: flagellar basal-body MS-ring/collar protein FliF [Pseudomonadales bacterium]|nr:flagellar M-ring protein FliF [Pseudomonadales bacterium]
MADLPVQSTAALPARSPAQSGDSGVPGAHFLRGAAGMPVVRQLGLLFAIAGSVAMAIVGVLWMQSPDYRPITGISTAQQAGAVAGLLDSNGLPHKVDNRSGVILVPQDRYHEARMILAGANQLDGQQSGYELLDAEQGFGVSQFMELARHRRSVEGELARSIMSLDGVQSARVLLAVPKSTTFLKDRRKPTASVTVRLLPGHALGEPQIRGIAFLVAASVPELKAEDVAVVDQTGRLLSLRDPDASMEQSERQLSYIARVESQLQDKINRLIAPIVGTERFGAQVTAELDFTRTEQAEELYNPDQTVVRSEQSLNEENVGTDTARGVPGTLSNQPPVTPTSAETAEAGGAVQQRRSRSEVTRNYEVDRTLSYTQQHVGTIRRLAVSVIVDDMPKVSAETGEVTAAPWTEEELAQLTASVKAAIGYSESRGDSVSVVNRTFFNPALEVPEAPAFWTEAWFLDLMKQILVGALLLFLAIGILRPLYRNLSQAGAAVVERNNLALAEMARSQDPNRLAMPGAGGGLLTSGGGGYASKMDTVRGLVEEDPGRVAQVVKHWVTSDE